MDDSQRPRPTAILYPLALGMFAIGTESFMIAGLLPGIASDLGVGEASAGQLVTAFALTYALGGPVLAIVTANLPRRALLVIAMAAFALGNALAWASHGYAGLMSARILLALTAGLYAPAAMALAGTLAAPAQRGRALATVSGGMTVAIVLGVPLGTLLGNALGWRATFGAVALLSLAATAGLAIGLPRSLGAGTAPPDLRARIDAARLPGVLPTLLVTLAWGTGTYATLTYLAPYLEQVSHLPPERMSAVMLLWGVSAAIGLALGGRASDRFGARRVVLFSLALLALSFAYLGMLAGLGQWGMAAVVPGIVMWGMSTWGFFPAQQSSLVARSGVGLAPVVLSLNASVQYAGFALGAMLGGLAVARWSAGQVGWVGSGFEVLALVLALVAGGRAAARK